MDAFWIMITHDVALVGGIIAAYATYKVYQFGYVNKVWLATMSACVFLVVRRIISFASNYADPILSWKLSLLEDILMTIIIVLAICGIWAFLSSFKKHQKCACANCLKIARF